MTEQDLQRWAALAHDLTPEQATVCTQRLPRWGDLQDLHGIVEGLAAASRLLDDEGHRSTSLGTLTAYAAARLLEGRRCVEHARGVSLSPELAELADLDRLIASGLRDGKPLDAILSEVDDRQRESASAPTGGRL